MKITRLRICSAWLLLAVLSAGAACAEEVALGHAYRRDSGELLYTELHRWAGAWHLVEYRQPDGDLFAVNELDFSRDFIAPAYTQRYLREQTQEGARWVDDKLVLFQGRREQVVPFGQPLVVNSGFFHFILDHWDALAAGNTVAFEFALPSRMETVDLQIRCVSAAASGIPDADPNWQYFRVELANKLIAWLVEPLNVAFDQQRRLMVFAGASNVRDSSGATPQVLVRYDYGPAATRLSRSDSSR